jgi:hypothetical protein
MEARGRKTQGVECQRNEFADADLVVDYERVGSRGVGSSASYGSYVPIAMLLPQNRANFRSSLRH